MYNKIDKILIVDLEFTCWMGRPPKGMEQEIVEIGVIEVDSKNKIKKKRRILVKPEKSNISSFCTKLTSITQKDVDENGISLDDACKILMNEYDSKNCFWGSWGSYDKTHFSRECRKKKIKYPFSRNHVDIQKHFSILQGNGKRSYGVEKALKKIGLEFQGKPHTAKDDAYNTGVIYLSMTEMV
jgi:inhibitor of KinA sporulation pathway (predicted exonuclease)